MTHQNDDQENVPNNVEEVDIDAAMEDEDMGKLATKVNNSIKEEAKIKGKESEISSKETAPTPSAPSAPSERKSSEQPYQPVKGFKLGMNEQKNVSELSLVDLFFYRNLYASLIIFLSGSLFFLMITKYEYSVITFVGRLVLFQVLAFFCYIVGSRIIRNTSGSPDIPLTNLTITEESVTRIVGSIVESTNKFIRAYVDILLVKSPKKTVLFAIGVQFVCLLGKYIAGHVLLYIGFIFAFTIPKIYEFKQDEINKIFGIAKSKVCHVAGIAWEKVPPNVKQYIQLAKNKIEEVTSERPIVGEKKKNE